MKLNKDGTRVIIETTNKVDGALEEGGVCGRVVSYPVTGALRVCGCSIHAIVESDPDDIIDGCQVSYRQMIEDCCEGGRVIRRGASI